MTENDWLILAGIAAFLIYLKRTTPAGAAALPNPSLNLPPCGSRVERRGDGLYLNGSLVGQY